MRISLKTSLISLSLLLVFAGLGVTSYLQFAYQKVIQTPVDAKSTARVVFTIKQGATGKEIGEDLKKLDLISSRWAFSKYLKENNLGNRLEAGKFILKKSYTIPKITEMLLNAKNPEVILTIREGLSLEEVDQLLAEEKILPEGMFLECAKNCIIEERFSFLDSKTKQLSLEGYLFPDTYYVDPETVSPKGLILRMLQNFDDKLTPELRSEIAKTGRSIHEIVTMASLIEKESRFEEEKPIISGILWKRLKEKMMLGVDATTRFALKKWTGDLLASDLAINSPYNTRKVGGLPPGPISNFGFESLKAAILPKESPFYYYLHDDEGTIHYAKTLEEHAKNKAQYLR